MTSEAQRRQRDDGVPLVISKCLREDRDTFPVTVKYFLFLFSCQYSQKVLPFAFNGTELKNIMVE